MQESNSVDVIVLSTLPNTPHRSIYQQMRVIPRVGELLKLEGAGFEVTTVLYDYPDALKSGCNIRVCVIPTK